MATKKSSTPQKSSSKKPTASPKELSTKTLSTALGKAVKAYGGRIVATNEADDSVTIEFEDIEVDVYLDNARRLVDAGDPIDEVMASFAETLRPSAVEPMGPESLCEGLRTMIEQHSVVPKGAVQRPLSPELAICLVWTDEEESVIRFVNPTLLEQHHVDTAAAWQHGEAQMNALLHTTPVDVDGVTKLGMLPTNSPFKASLVTAPSLRAAVEPSLGWPVRAVVPCRDFVFLFPKSAEELMGKLAPIVMKELGKSAYPLSAEVLEISDGGIKAIGSFRPRG